MSERLALISHRAPGDALAIDRGRTITAGQFLADVERLATALPPGRFVLNGCGQRYWFAVTLCANALAGRVSLLPHTRTPAALERIGLPYRDRGLGVVTDGPEILVDAPAVRVPDAVSTETSWPPASIESDAVVAVAFTSGTTGAPQPNEKTWRPMVMSARAEARALGMPDGGDADSWSLLATVPPQHMYGLESSVMLALHNGHAFDVSQPLHPHDIAAALQRLPMQRMLVTTPTHLRSLLRTDVGLHGTRRILCATAPLPLALAREAEARWDCLVHEIYGCTETGQIASRRTVDGDWWQALDGVRIEQRNGQTWASGAPVARPAALADVLELRDPASSSAPAPMFRLVGRHADLVNVGGRRASLAGLTATLLEIDGVEDGVFYQPEAADGREARLQAFVVAPSLDRAHLTAALRARIDPLFLPRPLHFVDALPRNAVGKLARADLAALAARRAEPGGRA